MKKYRENRAMADEYFEMRKREKLEDVQRENLRKQGELEKQAHELYETIKEENRQFEESKVRFETAKQMLESAKLNKEDPLLLKEIVSEFNDAESEYNSTKERVEKVRKERESQPDSITDPNIILNPNNELKEQSASEARDKIGELRGIADMRDAQQLKAKEKAREEMDGEMDPWMKRKLRTRTLDLRTKKGDAENATKVKQVIDKHENQNDKDNIENTIDIDKIDLSSAQSSTTISTQSASSQSSNEMPPRPPKVDIKNILKNIF